MKVALPQLELHKIDNQFQNIPHAHDDQYQITVPVKGTCYFNYENRDMTLGAGDGLVLNPSDRHYFHTSDDASLIVIRVNHGSGGAGITDPAARQHLEPGAMLSYFQRWAGQMLTVEPADRLAVEETQAMALHDLQQILRGGGTEGKPAKAAADRNVLRVLDYIHARYAEQLDIDTLSAIALQSRYHFIRSFKLATGMTPYQYVLHLRVEEAKAQLRRGSSTVTEISYSMGFSSPSQFYRTFMKFTGVTPEYYRGQS
ncbi:AraC family transcriptional regulator [Paenibacillus sp. NEAU-GSW1]|uniref:AraC family transcriptional regulator n=1 Tax=Paenibacillus sp. NEAU-GSW1 TaxID=2682486 RepID=UPI001C12BCC2|nr:AraC family transcriptional regulator [Paenibacillus sp. NEAU-GSW1]